MLRKIQEKPKENPTTVLQTSDVCIDRDDCGVARSGGHRNKSSLPDEIIRPAIVSG